MPRIKSIKRPVAHLQLRPRVSRHGRPLSEVYTISVPEVSRVVTKQDPKTGEFKTERKIVQHAITRPMTQQEIDEARYKVLRAEADTINYGKKNAQAGGKRKAVSA